MEAPKGLSEQDAARLAETWLGVMRARNFIDDVQLEAGRQFQSAVWRAYGAPFAKAIQPEPERGMDLSKFATPEELAAMDGQTKAKRFADRCKGALKTSGSSQHVGEDTIEVCQFDRQPNLANAAVVARIREGLDILADLIGIRKAGT